MMRKILVTGAGGYIGSVLVPSLIESGYDVIGVDLFFFGRQTLPPEDSHLKILREDIRSLSERVFQGVDAVIDLAALSNDPSGELDPERTWEINYQGRVRVAELAKKAGVKRYILPSSCSVYGFQEAVLDESSAPNPLTTYAKANLRAEQDVLTLADNRYCVVVLRQATVYGPSPRMRFDLAINGMVRGYLKNEKIPVLRDGTQWRPFVHVRDTTRAMQMMIEAPVGDVSGEVFNVGSDEQNCQIMSLAQRVVKAMDKPFKFEWYGHPDHRSYRVSFQKIKERLGFRANLTPEDGAREIVEQIREGLLNPDDPKTITVQWYKHLMEKQAFLNQGGLREANP
jgi:nucleoside-diphosphate-sugar epimerase